jgi:hypothetical protein
MVRGPALVIVLLIVLILAGCAASTSPAQGPASPRVRCLSDPRETGTRPLIFFFCIESP